MGDVTDFASDIEQQYRDSAIEAARGDVPRGEPGDCDLCGEWFGRLVGGACVPCREKYRLD